MKLKIVLLALVLMNFIAAGIFAQGKDGGYIMTVNGAIAMEEMGKTLTHEHIVTNFIGTDHPNQPFEDQEKAIEVILPYLLYLKSLGFNTLFECTPSYIGKNVDLLKALSQSSGLNIVTNTGYYAAVDKKYLPEHAYRDTAEELAERWLSEWEGGISHTGIRPGFIKLGVGSGALDSTEQKIVKAGMVLSKKTAMAMAVHTGDGAAMEGQYQLAKANNFDLNKLIWVHAQNATDDERIRMAEKGIWISLDGINETKLEEYLSMISKLKERSLLKRLLLSHDDGWSLEQNNDNLNLKLFGNGNSKPYRTISEKLVQRLFKIGFTQDQMDLIFVENPKKAMAIQN